MISLSRASMAEGHAGARRLAVDDDAAGAALAEAASELGAAQLKVVAQGVKQGHVRVVDGDLLILPVHPQRDLGHRRISADCLLKGYVNR